MNPSLAAVLTGAAMLLEGAAQASADPADAVRARINAASAQVRSMAVDFAFGSAPARMTGTFTYVKPGMSKSVFNLGPRRIESYLVDGTFYVHVWPDGSWRKLSYDPAHPPAEFVDFITSADAETISLLPDRVDDGVTVGVIQLDIHPPAPPATAAIGQTVQVTCSYDKTTYLMRACANASMSMTFSKYNDPANAVVLPVEAAGAVLIVNHAPAGSPPAP